MNKLLIPNTTQIPNVVLDDLMPCLSGSEFKVLLAIVRKTYGWQKRSDKISFTTLRQLTGLSRDAVNQAIKALGTVLTITPGRKGVPTLQGINEYALNIDVETGQLVRKSDRSENLTSQKTPHLLVRKSDSSKPKYSKPTKQRTKAIHPKEPNPAVNELRNFWATEYQKRFGVVYSFNHRVDGAHFKELLATFSDDVTLLKNRILKFFDLDDEWVQTTAGYSVGLFRNRINTLNSTGRRSQSAQQELPR